MLYLIGLGFDEKDINVKGLEAASNCDCYYELYTSYWQGDLKNLETLIGKEIKALKRSDLEDNLSDFLQKAKDNNIALFVSGDPLAATTHVDLIIEAKRKKIQTKIIHNVSIFSVLGETGLQLYKFGRTATIPLNGKMENVRKTIKENKKTGLHTLLLLDIDSEINLYMNVFHALKMLLKEKLVKKTDKLVAARFGNPSEIYYRLVSELMRKSISPPIALIIPGKLHFREKEFLEML